MRTEKLGFKEEVFQIEFKKIKDNKNNSEFHQDSNITINQKRLFEKLREVDLIFKEYIRLNNIKMDDIQINVKVLCEILVETDRYSQKYKLTQDLEMNEINEISVLAYYFIKYKPFSFEENNINEKFALYLILCCIYSKKNKNKKLISTEYCQMLEYGFKKFDLSKEGIILIARAIADKTDNIQ